MELPRQMLLTFDPQVSARFQADIKNAHGMLVDEINRKASKPLALAALAMTVSDPPTQAEVQAIADRCDELLEALQQP
jgi:hypothetical protein